MDRREMQEGLNQLADLLLFRERFSENPKAALEMYDVHGVPDEALRAIAQLSPEELALFGRVQRKLAELPIGEENCLLF